MDIHIFRWVAAWAIPENGTALVFIHVQSSIVLFLRP